jgi:hypothetical protein
MKEKHLEFFQSELDRTRNKEYDKKSLRLKYFEEFKPHKETTGISSEII